MLNDNDEFVGLYGYLDVEGEASKVIPLPLKGVHVKADVNDFIAEVKVTQCYQNEDNNNPVECSYYFPLDEAAAICGMKAEYEDGNVVNGVVKERQEAADMYRKAVHEGKQANLLQTVKRDVFALKVGNLPPGGYVKITITYITTLEARNDDAALVFPTCLAPRYLPATDSAPDNDFSAAMQPKTTSAKLFGLDIFAQFTCKSKIKSLTSPTHLEASFNIDGYQGSFNLREIPLSRDVVVLCQEEKAHQPRVSVEIAEDGSMVGMVSIFPSIEFRDLPREFVFLLDRSGSMGSKSYSTTDQPKTQIDQAKDALLLFLRALPPNSTFNVVSFGSHYEPLFEVSQPYNDETLKYASNMIDNMKADLGGTEILRPLKFIFDRPIDSGLERQVFALTDGQVWNDKDVFALIQKNCTHTGSTTKYSSRLFCVGVGANVSRHLCRGMARHGRGTARFVEEGDTTALHSKLMGQLKQALQPALDQVTIDWGSTQKKDSASSKKLQSSKTHVPSKVKTLLGYRSPEIDGQEASKPNKPTGIRMIPSFIPPIFNKERFISYAQFPNGSEIPSQVEVSCQTQDGPLELSLEITDQDIFNGSIANKMAARVAIAEFEDHQQVENEGIITRSEALEMAMKYNLGTELTSFLAVSDKTIVGSSSNTSRVEIPQVDYNSLSNAYHGSLACTMSPCSSISIKNQYRNSSRSDDLLFLVNTCMEDASIKLHSSIGIKKKKSKKWPFSFKKIFAWPKPNDTRSNMQIQKADELDIKPDKTNSIEEGQSPIRSNYTSSPREQMFTLCILQSANGSFPFSKQLADAIGIPEETLSQMKTLLDAENPKFDQKQKDISVATMLAVAALRLLFPKTKSIWELQEGKALAYLSDNGSQEIEQKISFIQSKLAEHVLP